MNRIFASLIVLCATFLVALPAASAVTIAWSPVGNAGNAADPLTGYGSVPYAFDIGTYDVTVSQYVEFLNAKATGADPLQLYNSGMSDPTYGGIDYDGSTYSVKPGDDNHPINYVTFYDTLRFANWLNNGQGSGDTETGAYTLLGGTPTPSNAHTITRSAGATVFLPSDNEWYKAAYYDPHTSSYFLFATSNNSIPNGTFPPGTSNSANYYNKHPGTTPENVTNVGAYSGTTSPSGAYDMAGNVWQWNERLFGSVNRGLRGNAFDNTGSPLPADVLYYDSGVSPTDGANVFGFRLASVPEPGTAVLAAFGLAGLGAWACRRRTA